MISDLTTTVNILRQEAATLGITEEEARKYGDIRHRRTWSLAIEHHLSMQAEAERQTLSQPTHYPEKNVGKSETYSIDSAQNQGESLLTSEKQAATPSLQQPQLEQSGRSYNKVSQRIRQARGFDQVVQNHIKALKTAAVETNQSILPIDNWVCPECHPQGEINCHLCAGTGKVDDIAAIGWTLAYMEMLGCSGREIEPLRRFLPESNILELNLKVCVAIKKSSEVLARTEKWVINQESLVSSN